MHDVSEHPAKLKEGRVRNSQNWDFNLCGERRCYTGHCAVATVGNEALSTFPGQQSMGRQDPETLCAH